MYTRICPSCEKTVEHSTENGRKRAEKKKSFCMSCSTKRSHVKYKDVYNEAVKKRDFNGEKNPFYNKKHSQETKELLSQINSQRKTSDETKEKLSISFSGSKNPMSGKTFYEVWIEKYGIEEADKRLEEKKRKNSIASSGKNNPMYGKATPKKAGNGWSGWYNNHFFRSLRELSFIIKELKNKEWKSAENIRIVYLNYDGTERTYAPDFIVEGKYLIEIKPERLIDSPLIKLKTAAALEYCKNNHLEYIIKDVEILEFKELISLVDNETIKFTEQTKEKYLERLKEHKE